MTLADHGDWVRAADRFARAYSLKPTSGIAFNWASALVELGKLLEAQELLHGIAHDSSVDPDLKRQIDQLRVTIEQRVARIRVHVVGDVSDSATLEVDGVAWPRAAWDVISPIDPGRHVLLLKDDDAELSRIALTLTAGDSRDLVMNVGPLDEARLPPISPMSRSSRAPAALFNPSGVHDKADDAADKPLRKSWILWTAVGAVVAGGVVTAVMLTRDREEDASPVGGNAGVIRW